MGHSEDHAWRPDLWAQEACEAVEEVDELERKKEESRMKKAFKKFRNMCRQAFESHEAARSNPGDGTLGMQAWRSVLRAMNLADWCEVQGWGDQEEMEEMMELANFYENMGYVSVGFIAVESEEQKAVVEAKLEKDEMLKQEGGSVASSTWMAKSQVGGAEGAAGMYGGTEMRQSAEGSSSESEGGVLMNGWFADSVEEELRKETDREYEALMAWWTKEQAKEKEQQKTKEEESEMQKVERKAEMLMAEMHKCEAMQAELQEKYEMLKTELRECEKQRAGAKEKYETAAATTIGHGIVAPSTFAISGCAMASASVATSGYAAAPACSASTGEATSMNVGYAGEVLTAIGHGSAAPSALAISGYVTASASAATSGHAAAPASLANTGKATAMSVAYAAAEAPTAAFKEEGAAKIGKNKKKRLRRKGEKEAGGGE